MSKVYSQEILEQVDDLLNVGIALSAQKDYNGLLELILTEARRIPGADAGTLYIRKPEHLEFRIIQNESLGLFQGGRGEPVNLPPVPLSMSNVSSFVALTGQSVNIPDVYEVDGFDFSGPKQYDKMTGYRTKSMLVLPLRNNEAEIIGVLQLINARSDNGEVVSFAPHFEKVISSLASQAAVALTNVQYLADIQNLFNCFVQVMATAIDARSPYNANHTRRVAKLTEKMAKAINVEKDGYWGSQCFGQDRTAQLVMAAWLHDIGKITIPLEVMDKTSRLEQRIDLVLQRFDYIEARNKANCLEEMASLEGDNRLERIKEIQNRLDEVTKRVNYARELVSRANQSATFVTPEMASQLQAIAEWKYLNDAGQELPWLTEDELAALSIQKGTLTDSERRMMESHVEVTRRLLDLIPFTNKLKQVPYFASIHHEHMDGKGYPHGLKGEEIPAEGRILALIDIFDALTASDRPYRKAMPLDAALRVLKSMVQEGKIDGDLFELFCRSKVWEGQI
ncbi:MAG: HD domain-containing phosphohydrolase [Acidobacteriota bacterium]